MQSTNRHLFTCQDLMYRRIIIGMAHNYRRRQKLRQQVARVTDLQGKGDQITINKSIPTVRIRTVSSIPDPIDGCSCPAETAHAAWCTRVTSRPARRRRRTLPARSCSTGTKTGLQWARTARRACSTMAAPIAPMGLKMEERNKGRGVAAVASGVGWGSDLTFLIYCIGLE